MDLHLKEKIILHHVGSKGSLPLSVSFKLVEMAKEREHDRTDGSDGEASQANDRVTQLGIG